MVLEIKKNTKVCIQKYPLEFIFKVRIWWIEELKLYELKRSYNMIKIEITRFNFVLLIYLSGLF